MTAPWEKYAAPAEDGPWAKYGATAVAPKPQPSRMEMLKAEAMTSLPGGMVRGLKDIVDTGAEYLSKLGSDSSRVKAENDAGKADFKAAQDLVGAGGSDVTRVGGNVLGTLPVGGALAAPLSGIKAAAPVVNALRSGGMSTGAAPVGLAAKTGDMALRMGAGGAVGAASAGLVDPDMAMMGGALGVALPPALKGAGMGFNALGRTLAGPAVPEATRLGAATARDAGYVIPPTQVKPSLVNRMLEGFSGKLTTAQNASARNQGISNDLLAADLGLPKGKPIMPEDIAGIRKNANKAYDALGKAGRFETDDAFRSAVDEAGAASKRLKADFPELSHEKVDALVASMSKKDGFDAQSAIEAMKRLRADGSANKLSFDDPAKKAMGAAQMKVAKALEDLVERNLETAGKTDLLAQFREARTTLAKAYDAEKALNPATGNADVRKLKKALERGSLTGGLKTAAQFGQQFPKAAQTVEQMGSLPQTSPLDWIPAGAIGMATGNPLAMAGVAARPMARAAALSPMVQNRLTRQGPNALAAISGDPALNQLLYRSNPQLANR